MKKQFLFATLVLATLFTACSKEEELSKNEGTTPVNFVIGGVGSRTVTSDGYVATFEEGDKVGIISEDTEPAIDNAEFTVSGNALNNSNTYNLVKDKAATFYAYYPRVEGATSNNVIYTVASDQSDADKFNANDFMTATTSLDANDENGTVSFNFDHQMAFVEVIFGENLEAAGVTSVSMGITKNEVNYDFTAETKLTTQGSSATITMFNATDQEATTKKFWAIIPPQTTTAGETLFTITVASGQTYSYKPANGETFDGNAIRRIKLEIKNDIPEVEPVVFSVSSVSINGWGNADSVADPDDVFNVTEEKLNIVASLPTYDETEDATNAIPTLENGRGDLTAAGWGAYNVTSANLVKDEENGNYISVVGNETAGSWNTQSLYYWAGNDYTILPTLSYVLSFSAKSESSGQISVMAMKKGSNAVFPIVDVTSSSDISSANATGTISSKTLTSSWTIYKFKITSNKTMTGGYGNLNNAVDNTEPSDICIAIKGNSSSSIYDIKNVTIEQQ